MTTLVTAYTYDAADRVASITYPSSARVVFTRDAAGRVSGVALTTPDGRQVPIATDIAWQAFGGLLGFTYGNGAPHTRQYDLDGRVTAIDTAGSQALDYGYDAAGNLTALADLATPAKSQTFGYDALDRLTAASGAYGSQGFQYDAVGNRLALTETGGVESYTYDTVSNRLLSAGGRAYQYDAAGNTVADGRFTYQYDARNRLAEVYSGQERKAAYGYDAQGQRVSKTVGTAGPDYGALAAEAAARAAAFEAAAASLLNEASTLTAQAATQEQAAYEATQAQAAALEAANAAYAEEQAIRAAAASDYAAAQAEATTADAAGDAATATAAQAEAASIAATVSAIAHRETATAALAAAVAAETQAEGLRTTAADAESEATSQEALALALRDAEGEYLDLAADQYAQETTLRAEAAALLATAEPELAKARAFRGKIDSAPKNNGQAVSNAQFLKQAERIEAEVAHLTEAAAAKTAEADAAHAAALQAEADAAQAAQGAITATLAAIALREQATAQRAEATVLDAEALALRAEAAAANLSANAQEALAIDESERREAALLEASTQYALAVEFRADAETALAAADAEADAAHATGVAADAASELAEQQAQAATQAAIALRTEAASRTADATAQQLLAAAAQTEADHYAALAEDPPSTETVTLFAYDQQGHLIGEYDAEGTLVREYLWLGDLPLASLTAAGEVNFIQADHLNTPVAMQDEAQATTWMATREPFGETATAGTAELPLRFPGQYLDAETGLHYNYFRDYDPSTGRYVESDPIGIKGGLNLYAYAEQKPSQRIDRLGLKAASSCGAQGGTEFPNEWPGYSFENACLRHDQCYATCKAVKAQCDAAFLTDMLNACETMDGFVRFMQIGKCKRNASLYALAVATRGQEAFDKAQACACKAKK